MTNSISSSNIDSSFLKAILNFQDWLLQEKEINVNTIMVDFVTLKDSFFYILMSECYILEDWTNKDLIVLKQAIYY